MKELFYYQSHMVDPHSDDAIVDQADITQRWNLQYKCDTIIESIGTPECKINIALFLKEIENQLDDQALFDFYYDIISKLIEVYSLNALGEHRDNKVEMPYKKEVKKALLFAENKYKNFVSNVLLPLFDIDQNITEQIINDKYQEILLPRVKRFVKSEPYLIKYFFYFGSLDNIVNFLYQLMMKDITTFNTECILQNYRRNQNDNDYKRPNGSNKNNRRS